MITISPLDCGSTCTKAINHPTRLLITPLLAFVLCSVALMPAFSQPPALPPNVADYLESGRFGEDGTLVDVRGNLQPFTRYVTTNWASMLDQFDTVAHSTREKLLVLAAADELAPADYLSFLEKLASVSKSAEFDTKVWSGVILPTRAKQGFLAYNYQNPRVAAVVERIRTSLAATDPLQTTAREISNAQANAPSLAANDANNDGNVVAIAPPNH